MFCPLSATEAKCLLPTINKHWKRCLGNYDFCKYPAAAYSSFSTDFANLRNPNNSIDRALLWKWGHWGKPNYPQAHKDLIKEVVAHWPAFIVHCAGLKRAIEAPETFAWWVQTLHRSKTYITAAFVTHLVHHKDPLPIIDQHNFRAMNTLLISVRPAHARKTKPATWSDIAKLKQFMLELLKHLPVGTTFSELDQFLMMYGKEQKG